MIDQIKNTEQSKDWDNLFASISINDSFLVPEHHWPKLQKSSLGKAERILLNHFLTYFMCEMFIHFEKLIIQYMEIHREQILLHVTAKQIDRFIQEEKGHIQGFESLARKLRPDLFMKNQPMFLQVSPSDEKVILNTPIISFFMMAALFEEMTLFVPTVMEENLKEASAPVLELMQFHAKEEKSHIGIDRKIVTSLSLKQSKWKTHWEMQSLLPLVVYSNTRVEKAWKQAAEFIAKELKLNKKQTQEISSKGLSKSDALGMRSYIQKNQEKPISGNGMLCFVLKQLLKWKGI